MLNLGPKSKPDQKFDEIFKISDLKKNFNTFAIIFNLILESGSCPLFEERKLLPRPYDLKIFSNLISSLLK